MDANKLALLDKAYKYIRKYAPQFGIMVYSPILAQLIIESNWGTSNKVINHGKWMHNYLGLKWRDNRCPIALGWFTETGSEQDANTGQYQTSEMKWCKFRSMEECILGYFQWLNIPIYDSIRGVTDPETYVKNIKAAGYATSIDYVNTIMNTIKKYNLTQYDMVNNKESEEKKMIINVHAGHNPDGKVACGAIGFIKESTEARNVKNEVVRLLKALGHTVYDCTADNGTSKSDVLNKIVSKCNAHSVDLDVSIHFNAGAGDSTGNGKTTGTEVLVYSTSSKSKSFAENICKSISALGFKNRGVKVRSDLYFLRNTKAPAMLVECCFVDDKDDVALYNYKQMAEAIVYGITGERLKESAPDNDEVEEVELFRVQVGAYGIYDNATDMQRRLKEAGFDAIIVRA